VKSVSFNQDVKALVPTSGVFPKFLTYSLLGRTDELLKLVSTAGNSAGVLDTKIVQSLEIWLPPLAEQRVIAETLSDVDELLAALDALIAKKRAVKRGAVQQLLSGETRLPGFSGGWTNRRLTDLVKLPTGQVNPLHEPFRSLVLIAPDHIESRTGRLLDKLTAGDQGAISGKYRFSPGDVIYSKIRPYLRKAHLAVFDGLCSADMYPLTPMANVSGAFLHSILLDNRFSAFAEAVSARSGIPKVNRSELAEFWLPLPSLREQQSIAEVLTDMDAEIEALKRRWEKTRQIKQGMMQELLTGRTRLV